MPSRSLLRAQLRRAWRRTICGPYSDRLVNSERGLQVHFCICLLEDFAASNVSRQLFIEPMVVFSDSTKRYPDLVICNARRVIGVVEFKYLPRSRPSVSKDLNTLCRLCSAGKSVVLTNDRFRGVAESRQYVIAPNSVLCWAGIYSGDPVTMPSSAISFLGSRFMRLDAITHGGGQAEIS